ncbi:MAG: hypothetical protein P4L90_16110 [Rhodopila sp.]|nr:hypothetical protein [Rhodopila sp.]
MSLSTLVTPAILDKVIGDLVPVFLTSVGGDLIAARNAAGSMLAAYDVETEEELRLAAEITSFGFGALDALGKSMNPDLPLNAVLRLRGCANSLQRSKHQCQRALDALRKRRRLAAVTAAEALAPSPASDNPDPAPPVATPDRPGIDKALGLIEFAREALEASGKKGVQSWGLSRQKRRAAERIAENFKRNQAEHARREALRDEEQASVATIETMPTVMPVAALSQSASPV